MYVEYDRRHSMEDNAVTIKNLLYKYSSVTISAVEPYMANLSSIAMKLYNERYCQVKVYTQKQGLIIELESTLKIN